MLRIVNCSFASVIIQNQLICRSSCSTLGAFIAAAASACTALEILRLRLEREQIPGLEKSPSDCDSDDDRCEGSDVSDCDEDGTAFEYSPAEVFYMDESAVLLGPNAATLDPLQVQDVPVVPLGGGNGGTLHSEENGDGDFPGKGSDTTDFGSSVRQLLHKCWALRKLQLPYAMLAHFEGAWRHAGLQSLTLHELVDVAHCEWAVRGPL